MEKKSQSGLRLNQKLTYGVGHILNDLCASMWFSYMLLYMHKVASFGNVNAGILILVGQVADALATPFVGYESDRSNNVRYGRRKIWHLVGVCCVAASFPFIFNLCIGCEHSPQYSRMIYYVPLIIIFQFGWASTQISHLSLIPELTICKKGKVELNAIRYFFTILSNLLVFAVCYILFELPDYKNSSEANNNISSADAKKFQYLALCVVGIGLFFMVIFHLFVKETQKSPSLCDNTEENTSNTGEKSAHVIQKTVKGWFKTLTFYQVGFLYMMTRLITNVSQVYISYFVLETLQLNKSSIAIAPAVIYVGGIVATLIAKRLNEKLGLKLTFLLGLCLVFGASIWFYFIRQIKHKTYHQEAYGSAGILGVGSSTLLITALAMISEMIGNNTDTSAFVYGSMSFLDKLSNGAAIMIIQAIHPCKNSLICCPACQRYYGYVMVYIPGAAAALALIVLISIGKKSIDTTVIDTVDTVSQDSSVPINVDMDKDVEYKDGSSSSGITSPRLR